MEVAGRVMSGYPCSCVGPTTRTCISDRKWNKKFLHQQLVGFLYGVEVCKTHSCATLKQKHFIQKYVFKNEEKKPQNA